LRGFRLQAEVAVREPSSDPPQQTSDFDAYDFDR
jgi:hypothetical protein